MSDKNKTGNTKVSHRDVRSPPPPPQSPGTVLRIVGKRAGVFGPRDAAPVCRPIAAFVLPLCFVGERKRWKIAFPGSTRPFHRSPRCPEIAGLAERTVTRGPFLCRASSRRLLTTKQQRSGKSEDKKSRSIYIKMNPEIAAMPLLWTLFTEIELARGCLLAVCESGANCRGQIS